MYPTASELISRLKKAGISKYRIAHKLNVSWNTVHMWDRNVWIPRPEKLKKLSELAEKLGD
jgi:DNA-binding transcriptional regulator YiaG